MADQSHLDDRYFVDQYVYNCPFCNRRNVAYSLTGAVGFDWTPDKPCTIYLILCRSCKNTSMHMSFDELEYFFVEQDRGGRRLYQFKIKSGEDAGEILDRAFFSSLPTSFFVLDKTGTSNS